MPVPPFHPRTNPMPPPTANASTQSDASTQSNAQQGQRIPKVLILSDSILSDTGKFFQDSKFNVSVHAFSGHTLSMLVKEVSKVLQLDAPDTVMVQSQMSPEMRLYGERQSSSWRWNGMHHKQESSSQEPLDMPDLNRKIDIINKILKGHEDNNTLSQESK